MTITANSRLSDVVAENPAAVELFENLDIDYFCGGNQSLGEALKERGMPVEALATELSRIAPHPAASGPDWRIEPLPKLIKHIVDKHHKFLHAELSALDILMKGITPLPDVQGAIHILKRDVELQMRKEEAIVFPAIVELQTRGIEEGKSQFGSVANLSRAMVHAHRKTARAIHEIRALTNNYNSASGVPEGCCALFQRLRTLAVDTHHHMHLENNILFPRAVYLENGEMSSHVV